MPNYVVTTGTLVRNAGQQYDSSEIDITITPNPGYTISPANFVIGGASYDSTTEEWIGGNVSPIVNKVKFIQDSTNVKARVYLGAAVFSADSTVIIDLDESTTNPILHSTNDVFGVCMDVEWPHDTSNNAVVTFAGLADGNTTITAGATGSSTEPTTKNVKRMESDMSSTTIFTFTVDPDSGYSLVDVPSVIIEEHESLVDTLTYSSVVDSSGNGVVTMYYTATEDSKSLTPCDLNNKVYINYSTLQDVVAVTNTIQSVTAPSDIPSLKQMTDVVVKGNPGTAYTIQLKDTSSSPAKYYNWSNGAMTTGTQTKTTSIPARGSQRHQVQLPTSTSAKNIAIKIGSSSGSTLATGVPQSDTDMVIAQHGINMVRVQLHTDNADKYGTLPNHLTIKMPERYKGANFKDPKRRVFTLYGTTAGSSTIFIPDGKISPYLVPNMLVIGPGVPHDTTVVSVRGQKITLSAAVNLATSTPLEFRKRSTQLVGFNFTIPPSTTTTSPTNYTTIVPKSGVKNPEKFVYGMRNKSTQAAASGGGTTTLSIKSGFDANDVVPGMKVTGDFITAGTTVTAVNYATKEIELSAVHSACVDGASVVVKENNNPHVRVADIKVEQSGANVVIRGYLEVRKLAATSGTINIQLDELIHAA